MGHLGAVRPATRPRGASQSGRASGPPSGERHPTWTVDDDGLADFSSIQAAINAALPGDRVEVQPGTYAGTIDFLGKAILVESAAGPEATIVDGAGATAAVFQNGEGRTNVLRGFTLTGGPVQTGSGGQNIGLGVVISGASPVIEVNIITGNYVRVAGRSVAVGGINVTGESRPLIFNNAIVRNGAVSGGSSTRAPGLRLFGSGVRAVVAFNTISGNLVPDTGSGSNVTGGGALCQSGALAVFTGNAVSGNTAPQINGCPGLTVVGGAGNPVFAVPPPPASNSVGYRDSVDDRRSQVAVNSDFGPVPSVGDFIELHVDGVARQVTDAAPPSAAK